MNVLCLDMEGVLTPEIWHHVRSRSGVAELGVTTREVKDYRELMDRRVEICARHGITLADLQGFISELSPMEGARAFVDWARERYQVLVLSDTFYEFAGPLIRQLGNPALFCHRMEYDAEAKRLRYTLRLENAKQKAVEALRGLNFRTAAVGDAYNDVRMLRAADVGVLFRAPQAVTREFPEFPSLGEYGELREYLGINL
jgi:phosphoserine/homoserine phosphotransferase